MTEEQLKRKSTSLSPFAKAVIDATFKNWMRGVLTTCNAEQVELLGVGTVWIPSSQNGENHAH